jgi:hypothetical protein
MLYEAVLTKLNAMWIGKVVTGSFQNEFEVFFGLEQMIQDEVLPEYELQCDWNRCKHMLPRPNME